MPDFSELSSELAGWVWSSPLFFFLLGCGLLFSVATKFVQFRILTHGIDCIRGKYDDPDDTGQISHFQALSAALSATIGLGNIAGVAVAVSLGGPGAIFWMWVVGLFGMALKYAECSLAVMYRDVLDVPDPSAPALIEADAETHALEYEGEAPPADRAERGAVAQARGEVRGGPMWYMLKGLAEPLRKKGNPFWILFRLNAVLFSIAVMGAALGGGNMFQGWNVGNVLQNNFEIDRFFSATVVSILVAMVIIGGIKRIGRVASKLVPFMCLVYVTGALYVMALHYDQIGPMLALIFESAFGPADGQGAFAGGTVAYAFQWGLRRASFSNEAGEGSAAMAHAAARTNEPIREGVVAGIGPLIDTLIICTMSALVLLLTGSWNRPAIGVVESVEGNRVHVRPAADLDETFQAAYLRELESDTQRFDIYLDRTPTFDGPNMVANLPFELQSDPNDGWQAIRSLILSTAKVDKDDAEEQEKVAAIAPGQEVHLRFDGAELMRFSFDFCLPGFGKFMITLGVCFFAFSTMISWCYYGEKGAEYLLGPAAILPYKFVFVAFVFLGMVLERFEWVFNYSDALSGIMVICNLPAVLVLLPVVLRSGADYFRRLDSGAMRPDR